MADEALIEAVRSYSCFWQTGSKEYKDIKAKENAWKEVATKVSLILLQVISKNAR